jgi:hypothetical protein
MSSSPIDSESMVTVNVIGCRYAMTVCEVRWDGWRLSVGMSKLLGWKGRVLCAYRQRGEWAAHRSRSETMPHSAVNTEGAGTLCQRDRSRKEADGGLHRDRLRGKRRATPHVPTGNHVHSDKQTHLATRPSPTAFFLSSFQYGWGSVG